MKNMNIFALRIGLSILFIGVFPGQNIQSGVPENFLSGSQLPQTFLKIQGPQNSTKPRPFRKNILRNKKMASSSFITENAYKYLLTKLESGNSIYNMLIEKKWGYESNSQQSQTNRVAIQASSTENLTNHPNNLILIIFVVTVLLVMFYSLLSIKKKQLRAKGSGLKRIQKYHHNLFINIANRSMPKADDSRERDAMIIQKLHVAIKEQKIFRNSSLNITDLARKLNTNRLYLSKIINNQYNKNFNTFVNEFRIQEAVEMFLQNRHKEVTIEAIAKDVGFTNRTTFFIAFKKIHRISPSDFIKRLENLEIRQYNKIKFDSTDNLNYPMLNEYYKTE